MQILIIRTDGTEETIDGKTEDIPKLIGAPVLDGVNLRDGRYMYVDDNGYEVRSVDKGVNEYGAAVIEMETVGAKKPVNKKATALYHKICIPGTTHQIVGDVAIVPIEYF